MRLCFNRKNKTLRAVFTTKKCLAALETSWKTFAALGGGAAQTPDVRALVEAVLDDDRFREQRAAKLDLDDFLALLAAFNARGLHFA